MMSMVGQICGVNPGRMGIRGTNFERPEEWQVGGHILMSKDGGTLSLQTLRSDGTSWFCALTGGTPAERLNLTGVLAEHNVTGA